MMGKVGVIGAGQMGAGIAQVAAQAGYGVMLSDTSLAAAEKGKAGIGKILSRAVSKEKITQARADEIMGIGSDGDAPGRARAGPLRAHR